jgi:hypothetical protein
MSNKKEADFETLAPLGYFIPKLCGCYQGDTFDGLCNLI